jgi:hypothetical protein
MARALPVKNVLSRLGYQPVEGRDYRASWSNSEVEHFIYLLSSRAGSPPGASFGLRNLRADRFAAKCIIRHGWSFFHTVNEGRKETDCFMQFSFARFELFWNRRPIPLRRLDDLDFAACVERMVEDRLVPLVEEVTSKQKLLEILVSDKEPFPWSATNAAIRAAIIVAIANQTGASPSEIRTDLLSKAVRISQGLTKHSPFVNRPEDYLIKVQEDWVSNQG